MGTTVKIMIITVHFRENVSEFSTNFKIKKNMVTIFREK